MAVEGIANSLQALGHEQAGQDPSPQGTPSRLGVTKAGLAVEDTFTPSAQDPAVQNAQDAGIFQPSQRAPLAQVTANPQFVSTAPNPENGAPQTPLASTNSPAVNAQPAPANASGNASNAGNGTETAAASANSANVQSEIQALNFALPELGLTTSQIEQIDRIASLINDFNPSAYSYLVNQFQAQARQSAQQTGANATGTGAATAGPANSATGAGTGANETGFQVRQVSIHFTAPATPTGPAANPNGQVRAPNTAQSNSGGLQLQQVLFTFANSNGQTFQVQAPQQTTANPQADRLR